MADLNNAARSVRCVDRAPRIKLSELERLAKQRRERARAFASINRVTEVARERVQDLLLGLFGYGLPAWLHGVDDVDLPEGLVLNDFKKGGKMQDNLYHWTQIVPVTDGCALRLLVNDPSCRNRVPADRLPWFPEWPWSDQSFQGEDGLKEFVLDSAAIQKGLQIMADRYPHYWEEFIDENEDAVTINIFGQCVVYGGLEFSERD